MTKKLSADFLREAIHANGWGTLAEASASYSPDPIPEPQPETPGIPIVVDPAALTDEQEQLVADCFKVVAACLLNDPDGVYTALLEALMAGAA